MRRTALVLLPLLWHSACGADHRSIALEDLEDELKTLVCKSYSGCGQYPDEATCRADAPFNIEQLKASVKAGRIRYDGVEAATCLDAAAGNLCEVSTGSSQSTKACDDTFQGTIDPGGPCFNNEECVSQQCGDGTGCDGSMACCPGMCRSVALVAAGGDCSAGARCAAGLYCESAPNTPAPTCKALVTTAGQPCNVSQACGPGLSCRFGDPGVQPVCTPLPGRDGDCEPLDLPCKSRGDFCDETTHKCSARLAVGATCTTTPECVGYARCDGASHTCVARSPIGEACSQQEDCIDFLPCLNGVCAANEAPPVCF